MNVFLLLGIIITLGIILYQDVKHRTLDIKFAIVLLLLCVGYNIVHPILDYKNALLIIGFILVNILCVTVYFSIKHKQIINPIDSKIGLGDIVFFIIIAPLFHLKSYILFFITGLLFSLLVYAVVIRFREKQKTIPLAGYLSLYLGMILLSNTFFKTTIFNLGI